MRAMSVQVTVWCKWLLLETQCCGCSVLVQASRVEARNLLDTPGAS